MTRAVASKFTASDASSPALHFGSFACGRREVFCHGRTPTHDPRLLAAQQPPRLLSFANHEGQVLVPRDLPTGLLSNMPRVHSRRGSGRARHGLRLRFFSRGQTGPAWHLALLPRFDGMALSSARVRTVPEVASSRTIGSAKRFRCATREP